jgi:renalase
MKDVMIIGAGLAGLTCARQLRHAGFNVIIVEKSSGVGGRMATRRLQGTWVDHGAQYITVRHDGFERFIHKLEEKGIVQKWTRNFHYLTESGLRPPTADEMYPRYCCPEGMTAIPKYLANEHLAHGQRIIFNTRIVAVNCDGGKWQLITDQREFLEASAVVATMPAPQFLPLFDSVLAAAPVFQQAVRSVQFSPSITIMAGYGAENIVPPEWQAIRCLSDPVLSWIGLDSSKHPDKATQPVFVFQSTPEFAKGSMDEPDLELAGKPILNRVGKHLAKWLSSPEWWQVHRWRYAIAEEVLGAACLSTAVPLPLVCAGDWCAGSNVEAAYRSGLAAAESLMELLK